MPGCSYLPDFRSCCRVPPPAWWERRSSTHAPAAAMQWSCLEAQRIRLHGWYAALFLWHPSISMYTWCRFAISIRRQTAALIEGGQSIPQKHLKWALLSASSPFACEVLVRPFRIFPMKESHHKSWKTRPKIRRPTTEASHLLVSRGASHCVDLCGTTLMVWVKLLKIREWQIWVVSGSMKSCFAAAWLWAYAYFIMFDQLESNLIAFDNNSSFYLGSLFLLPHLKFLVSRRGVS